MTLKDRVKGSVTFQRFHAGALWYATDDQWEFPVPVADTGTGESGDPVFLPVDKGIMFMRWIRKHMATEATLREEAGQELL